MQPICGAVAGGTAGGAAPPEMSKQAVRGTTLHQIATRQNGKEATVLLCFCAMGTKIREHELKE